MRFTKKLNLKNIGPINESSVIIDGLTIITGLNSTGKTTIGSIPTAYLLFYEEIIV